MGDSPVMCYSPPMARIIHASSVLPQIGSGAVVAAGFLQMRCMPLLLLRLFPSFGDSLVVSLVVHFRPPMAPIVHACSVLSLVDCALLQRLISGYSSSGLNLLFFHAAGSRDAALYFLLLWDLYGIFVLHVPIPGFRLPFGRCNPLFTESPPLGCSYAAVLHVSRFFICVGILFFFEFALYLVLLISCFHYYGDMFYCFALDNSSAECLSAVF